MIEARVRASIEAYIAAWNERDAGQRMRLIEQACAEDLLMRTPGKRIDGRSDLLLSFVGAALPSPPR